MVPQEAASRLVRLIGPSSFLLLLWILSSCNTDGNSNADVVGLHERTRDLQVGHVVGLELWNSGVFPRKVADLSDGSAFESSQLSFFNCVKSLKFFNCKAFTLRAVVTGDVSSVKYRVGGNPDFIEQSSPFYLCGSSFLGLYVKRCRELDNGFHTISATPYSENGAEGEVSFTASFAIFPSAKEAEPKPCGTPRVSERERATLVYF